MLAPESQSYLMKRHARNGDAVGVALEITDIHLRIVEYELPSSRTENMIRSIDYQFGFDLIHEKGDCNAL